MTMSLDEVRLDELVSLERGEIDRRIFADEEIFEREMELIFGRAWQFLCHQTQIPKPGDFFETPMGRDNVLSVRQKDGGIKALLNTCTHRGNAVCRAEEGNTKAFMCTYHGWSFDLAGNLIGVPDIDLFYKGDLDKSKYGLHEVAQMAIYHGFVFATMDPTAPPLEEYLGTMGKLGLDLLAARGDMEAVPGVQKFIIDCNWKFAVDNLFDWYHPQVTHMSAMSLGLFARAEMDDDPDVGGAVLTTGEKLELTVQKDGGKFDIAMIAEYGHAIAGPSVKGSRSPMIDHSWRERPEALEMLGPIGIEVAGHPNIFPNAWITSGTQLSLRVPVSPNKTEIWWFSFVDRNADAEKRKVSVGRSNHVFGPSGLLEQEDGENWGQSTLQTRGFRSQRIPQILRMNLGRGNVIKEHGLARIEGTTSEHAQLWTYHAWAQWMKGLEWDALKKATAPPDVI